MIAHPNDKPVAVVLGGTFPHRELLRNLRGRGYYTILVDYYEMPPAKDQADEHIRESTLDRLAVLEIAKRHNARLVITTCVDQANVTACYVAEKLGLTRPYSYDIALTVTNKILMKSRMLEHGIPTSRYVRTKEPDDCDKHDLTYPLVIKPADSNSSRGVSRSDHPEDTRRFVQSALQLSRSREALIEEFKTGREISFDSFVENGTVHILIARERRKIVAGMADIQQIYGSFWPAELPQSTLTKLKEIAENIARVFRLDNTPLMVQAIVDGSDVNIIEFAPRIGGGENYRIIRMATGYDVVDAAVDSFLGVSPALKYDVPTRFFADNYLYVKPGVFGNIGGADDLLEKGVIEYLATYKARGASIGNEISSNNRVGAFTVSSRNIKGLQARLRDAINHVEVFDLDGKPIMRRDIYSAGP